MKIGIVSNLYPPTIRGGAELVAQRIADELYARGHDVFVLSTQPFEGVRSWKPQLTANDLGRIYRFYPFNLYHLLRDRKPFPIRALWHLIDMFSPLPALAMEKVINEEQPDVVITHNLKGMGLQVIKAIQKKNVFHIHTLHDVQLSVPSGLLVPGEEQKGLNASWLRVWYENTMKKILGKPDVVVSPSRFLAGFYQGRGMFKNQKIEVVPNPPPPRMDIVRSQRIPGPVRLAFVGQLERHKGILLLLEAMNAFGPEVELHVAGTGSLEEYVNDWCARDKRVRRHGFISMGNLNKLLAASDAMVLPSLCYENSPTIIYESFQMGVPVLASRIGGVPELVREGENGWMFEPGNKEELIEKIRRLVEHKEEFWRWSDRIEEESKRYSIKRYVDRLETFFPRV